MGGLTEGIKTANSVVRTVIIGILVAVIGFGGYFGYSAFIKPLLHDRQALQEANNLLASTKVELEASMEQLKSANRQIEIQEATISDQKVQIDELNVQVEKLETAMRLLKVDHRLANLKVISVEKDPETNEITTRVSLQEVDADGNALEEAREFVTKGEKVYVDFWLAKFEDKYIEENDLLRSTTLCMFKSIYGENEAPSEGARIEKPWVRPAAYASGSKMTDFEERIWTDFWTIANDNSKSKELGIRANHGQAIYFKAEEGKSYQIELRASDGLSVKSADGPPEPPEG